MDFEHKFHFDSAAFPFALSLPVAQSLLGAGLFLRPVLSLRRGWVDCVSFCRLEESVPQQSRFINKVEVGWMVGSLSFSIFRFGNGGWVAVRVSSYHYGNGGWAAVVCLSIGLCYP